MFLATVTALAAPFKPRQFNVRTCCIAFGPGTCTVRELLLAINTNSVAFLICLIQFGPGFFRFQMLLLQLELGMCYTHTRFVDVLNHAPFQMGIHSYFCEIIILLVTWHLSTPSCYLYTELLVQEDIHNAQDDLRLNQVAVVGGKVEGEGEIELFGTEIGCRGNYCMASRRSWW